MSGHSKWATIKRKKGAADAQRGKLFSKIVKEITVAAREGGGAIETNAKLRTLVDKAKEANMPADNIKRAIQRGTGELPGVSYESITYEGYGPGGVALLVECLTDNKKRTAADVRSMMSKHGGNMGEAGCVSWMFEKKGTLILDKSKVSSEDQLLSDALEAGAEDVKIEESAYNVITDPSGFEGVKTAITGKYPITEAEVTFVPKNYVKLEGKEAQQLLNLISNLEDMDDVQNVYANFDIADEIIESLQQE